MKTCFKCGESKPLDEFYRHPRMADGHLGKCKACAKRDVMARESVKRGDPEWVESERVRGREKYHRLYRPETPMVKVRVPGNERQKANARNAISNAIRDGRIRKPNRCERCGSEPPPRHLHAHHDDYSKPLYVEWLCARCHDSEHRVAS